MKEIRVLLQGPRLRGHWFPLQALESPCVGARIIDEFHVSFFENVLLKSFLKEGTKPIPELR